MFFIDQCYEEGLGVEQNIGLAIEWYERSGNLNNADALYQLGDFYLNGIGVDQDNSIAKDYFLRASALGNTDADVKLQQIQDDSKTN